MEYMKEYYIWLLSVMGAANPRSLRLISYFGSVEAVYEALTAASEESAAEFLKAGEAKALKNTSINKACELIDWCNKHNYNIVTIGDDDYPAPLKQIYNPPVVLFTEGNIKGLADSVCVNVVGTRNPSEYSCSIATDLCGKLAKLGITIVSGFALGLDKFAMDAALANNGRVAGVLACGIDVDYPRDSKVYRTQVAESGGVAISELLPRDTTRSSYFQQRNRIMSGLSGGTVIVEAADVSGCHITALHAINQNRDLFCVPPHDIRNPRYNGVFRYLRDGAIPVFSYIDIVNEYLSDVCGKLTEEPITASAKPKQIEKLQPTTLPESKLKKSAKNQKSQQTSAETAIMFENKKVIPQAAPKADYSSLSDQHAKIVEALAKSKLTFDEIIEQELCDKDNAHEILLDMELDGLIEKIAGDSYQLLK
jgi:DNA processing protein